MTAERPGCVLRVPSFQGNIYLCISARAKSEWSFKEVFGTPLQQEQWHFSSLSSCCRCFAVRWSFENTNYSAQSLLRGQILHSRQMLSPKYFSHVIQKPLSHFLLGIIKHLFFFPGLKTKKLIQIENKSEVWRTLWVYFHFMPLETCTPLHLAGNYYSFRLTSFIQPFLIPISSIQC